MNMFWKLRDVSIY